MVTVSQIFWVGSLSWLIAGLNVVFMPVYGRCIYLFIYIYISNYTYLIIYIPIYLAIYRNIYIYIYTEWVSKTTYSWRAPPFFESSFDMLAWPRTFSSPICEPWCWYMHTYITGWCKCWAVMLVCIFQHHGSHMANMGNVVRPSLNFALIVYWYVRGQTYRVCREHA